MPSCDPLSDLIRDRDVSHNILIYMNFRSNLSFGDRAFAEHFLAWYAAPPGSLIADFERQLLGRALPDLFGYHLLQLGCHHVEDLLASSRITHQVLIDLGPTLNPRAQLHCVEDALPLAPNSIDVLLLPHVLEFAADPHRVLREAERVLIGEGHLVILAFNPWSWFGLWSLLARWRGHAPWGGRFIAVARVKDWLQLLGFDILRIERAAYRPPLRSAAFNRRLEFMDRLGAFCWPWFGNVFLIVARKRVEGMTPLKASWRQRRRLLAGGVIEPSTRGCWRPSGESERRRG